MAAAKSGVYLAPLRLMAAEFWDRMRQAGVPCSLITGEERLPDPDARHISSTIEMLATDAEYDVAIIDEAQMIADKDRGWAWTQAIVGVNAKLVILVGSPDAENVLREIATRLGEPLEIERTERLTPLEVADRPLDPDQKAETASAFISFSRRDVLAWKQTLGSSDCAVVYGALSPEVRREEARRFVAGEAQDCLGDGCHRHGTEPAGEDHRVHHAHEVGRRKGNHARAIPPSARLRDARAATECMRQGS